jgi:hypothetical protein
MANTTSANLKLTVQATGENSGTWGQITNTNLLFLNKQLVVMMQLELLQVQL